MDVAAIDEALWRTARELAASPDGLAVEGLGVLRAGRLEPAPAGPPPTGFDAPRLVVRVADELGVPDADVRSRLRAALEQALASAAGRPAPLGNLGLLERRDGRLTYHPSRRASPAPDDTIDALLATWRAPFDTLAERVDALCEAMTAVPGALPPEAQRRLLDELDYDLDEDDWKRFAARIVAALPF